MAIAKLGEVIVGRLELEPGWKWSECVEPIAGNESCMAEHTGITLSGRMKVVMDDGTEAETGPGEAYTIPPGHDAWVIGNEPYVGFDFTDMPLYGVTQSQAVVPSCSAIGCTALLRSARSRLSQGLDYARQRVRRTPATDQSTADPKV